jgi:predicted amidohydrolase YtcJ
MQPRTIERKGWISMKADLILRGNKVFTGLANQPEAAAVVIKANKIVDVCSIEKSQSYLGEETKELTYTDQLIVPGFHDAHLHVILGSLVENFSVSLGKAKSEEERRRSSKNTPTVTRRKSGLLDLAGIGMPGKAKRTRSKVRWTGCCLTAPFFSLM